MKITFIKTGKRVKPKENLFNTYLKKQSNKKESIKNIIDNKNEKSKKYNNFFSVNNKNNFSKSSDKARNSKKTNNIEIGEVFKTIFKKNQIVILTLALMLVTAGYMNYNNKSGEENISIAELGDAKLVSTNLIENESENDENIYNTNETNETIENNIEDKESNENNIESRKSNEIKNQCRNK